MPPPGDSFGSSRQPPMHAGRMFVGEMAFDMQNLTERAGCRPDASVPASRETALVVAERERHAGLRTGGDRALGLARGSAPAAFRTTPACPRRQPPRPARHAANAAWPERSPRCRDRRATSANSVRQVRRSAAAKSAARVRVAVDAAHETQPRTLALNGLDDIAAPASEADHGGIDHGRDSRRCAGEYGKTRASSIRSVRRSDQPAFASKEQICQQEQTWTATSNTNAG